jgi:Fe-S-cluster-containing dehydrogenase component
MEKWNLIIDVALCENCHNCALAAKDEHVGNDFPGYSAPHQALGNNVIEIHRKVRGAGSMLDAAYLPTMCNHCDDAPCVKTGGGAVRKREDGIVIIDPVKAKGRRDLLDACPYGAIVWNEELELPQTWIFDAHLLDQGWRAPRCAQVCPTGALQAAKITDEEMKGRASAERLEVLKPELGIRPRVYYRSLHRFTHCFIGGEVTAVISGRSECVEGATVTLRRAECVIEQASTDSFGEFRFDRLTPGGDEYEIDVSHPSHGRASRRARLGEGSLSLGEIELRPSTTSSEESS